MHEVSRGFTFSYSVQGMRLNCAAQLCSAFGIISHFSYRELARLGYQGCHLSFFFFFGEVIAKHLAKSDVECDKNLLPA